MVMAKIAFLAIREDMMHQVKRVSKKIDVDVEIKVVTSENAVAEAKLSVQNGADVVITRGNHAALIKRNTNIPIVEVVLTGQEIAILIQEAKEILQKPSPVIGLVGFGNMLSSTKLLDEVLDVTIKEYFVDYSEELEGAVGKAAKDNVDIIIGGEIVTSCAKKIGIPTLFLKSREDSIREAFRIAEKVIYASDLEKKNTAEFKTILDYSFDGIIKLNNQGIIVVLNYLAEKILRKTSEDMIGKHITEAFNILDDNVIKRVLTEGKGMYHTLLQKENLALVSNIAPVVIDGKIEGAILSFQEFRKIEELEAAIRKELYSKGYVAKATFKNIIEESIEINKLKSLAKLYAKYDSPIVISGESGVGKKMFAQSIHNESLRRNNPYVAVNCAAMPAEQLEKKLYGYLESNFYNSSTIIKKGMFEVAHTGTIFLENVCELDIYGQASLLRVLNEGSITRMGDDRALPINVRIICSTNKNLNNLTKEGKFNEDLYYMLNVLELNISPLRKRKDDISTLLDYFIDMYNNMYKKYVMFTDGARELIYSYPWYGNAQQLKKFCEKIIIVAPKKVLDEHFVNEHLEYFSPDTEESKYDNRSEGKKVVVYESPEAAAILELLDKYNGNRSKVAEELNISKTTLWRKVKKYNIENKFAL
jgi:transcriptional regulator with PAS, ATPase and Fis domain